MEKKPLRAAMPTVTGWIDSLREAFGDDQINPQIKAGIDGQPTFWARENGREVGTKAAPAGDRAVSLAAVHLGPLNPANAPKQKGRF